jgi:hypothetical protein
MDDHDLNKHMHMDDHDLNKHMHMDDHDLNKHMQVERNNGRIFKHLWKIGEKEQKLDCTIYYYDHCFTIYAIHI